MRANLVFGAALAPTVVGALFFAPVVVQAGDDHRLGDHPAVVVQRLQKTAGYDYASKFYPHPAGLRLYAQQPRDESDALPTADALADAHAMPTGQHSKQDRATQVRSSRSGG